jgi:hippurate hydrolase
LIGLIDLGEGRATEEDLVTDSMWAGLDELSGHLADLYRDLHQHPELSLREYRTTRLVADPLRRLGCEVTE